MTPLVGLAANAYSPAGTKDSTGPRFGMKVSNPAIIPNVPAKGTCKVQRPVAMRMPIMTMEIALAANHDCNI